MNVDVIYTKWNRIALTIVDGRIKDWKRHPEVCIMLEHVNEEFARVYLAESLKEFSADQIRQYATLCDSVGTPHKVFFQDLQMECSPTCLRYLYHALCILKLSGGLPIVEIGGGYGGLAFAVDFVGKIKDVQVPRYTILDLPNIQKLQEFYLKQLPMTIPVVYTSPQEPSFLVSNYCLAEMGDKNRQRYIQDVVIPYAKRGFLIWNSRASYAALEPHFHVTVGEEIPKTGPFNKLLTFETRA